MNCTAEQVINGLINYADNEVMGKLPTSGKWVAGTAIGIASQKASNVIDALRNNAVVKMLGIVDDEGCIDVDALISALKASADKYGRFSVSVPLIGNMTFSSSDVDSLKNYIR